MVAELHATPLRTPIRNHHNCADHVSPNLQRYHRTVFSKIVERFLQNADALSPKIARKSFRQNHRTRFLQIAEQVFSKASNVFPPTLQCISPHVLSKNAEHFTPNLQVVSPISEQRTFCSILLGDNPVSNLSLHMLRAPCFALWVVGCGSLVTPVPPTRPRAPRSTLWTMG